MNDLHVALLGYGTVGKGVFASVYKHQERLKTLLGRGVKITAVLVTDVHKHQLPDEKVLLTDRYEDIINQEKLDVVIDAIVGTEPGFGYLRQAIERGCHVITANKQMFAHHGAELEELAAEKGVTVGFEATVAGGIPVIQTLNRLLNVNKVTKLQGILNGTSNFILTKMRDDGLTFEAALQLAQELGYAEADPTNDIEGFDAFYKAVVLSNVIFGRQPEWKQVVRKGISHITIEQIRFFEQLGLKFKHVASLEETASSISCSVRPALVSAEHPLFAVEDVQNSIHIEADIVGSISLQGPGAGMFPTASAVIEDLIHIGSANKRNYFIEETDVQDSERSSNWIVVGETDLKKEDVEVAEELASDVYLINLQDTAKVQELEEKGAVCFELLGELKQSHVVQHIG